MFLIGNGHSVWHGKGDFKILCLIEYGHRFWHGKQDLIILGETDIMCVMGERSDIGQRNMAMILVGIKTSYLMYACMCECSPLYISPNNCRDCVDPS